MFRSIIVINEVVIVNYNYNFNRLQFKYRISFTIKKK